jgi:hypothetical protein
MTPDELLGRYRHLRAISTRHHSAALKFLARPTIMEHARRLGLARGQVLVADSAGEMTLVFDLAIYSAKEGGSRAIDRYAKAAQLPLGSDEALMLNAMRAARFSLWRIECRHEASGLVLTDLVRKAEAWLIDENLAASVPEGTILAGRLCAPESFVMSGGVMVPVDAEMLERVLAEPSVWRCAEPARVADDPRFATAIYRAAVECGVMARVTFE